MPAKLTQEEFLRRCFLVHGDSYDFSYSEYRSSQTKVKVRCKKHGIFESVPSSLMDGRGCKKCAWEQNGINHRMSEDEFLKRSLEVHDGRYDYSDVKYVTGRTKVEILCKCCNKVFKMQPEAHLAGQGCPSCCKTGYSPSKAGFLYVFNDGGDLTKIGITNSTPQKRCNDINRRADKRFAVLKAYRFDDGSTPPKIESLMLKELRATYKGCVDSFNGCKETFYDVNLATLLNRIEQLISQQTAAQAATKEQHSSNLASQEA